jgi:hypothetical protein
VWIKEKFKVLGLVLEFMLALLGLNFRVLGVLEFRLALSGLKFRV